MASPAGLRMSMLDIDRGSPLPLYSQVKHAVASQVEAGTLVPGDRLPSEPELCAHFGLSRTTVRQALTELEVEGTLRREKGRGTFVAAKPESSGFLQSSLGFFDEATRQGHSVDSKVLRVTREALPGWAIGALQLPAGADGVTVERLRSLDGSPVMYVQNHLLEEFAVTHAVDRPGPGVAVRDAARSPRGVRGGRPAHRRGRDRPRRACRPAGGGPGFPPAVRGVRVLERRPAPVRVLPGLASLGPLPDRGPGDAFVSGAVLVTGATSGIGRAAALALADRGWWVAAGGRDAERGSQLAGELGDRGTFVAGDLLEDGTPERLCAEVVAERGGLDALVNNAAIHERATLEDMTSEQLDRILAADLRAPMLMARAAVRQMVATAGGVIVNVSSEAGLVAVPGQVAYNVAKAGLNMLTRSIAVDHAAEGVRAVSVCPGTTRTPLVERPSPPRRTRRARARAGRVRPARRLGRVEEIAAAICFAASSEAAFMTGTELSSTVATRPPERGRK